ncbi:MULTISPECIES: SDR family oxidoreductase [Nocardioides]|uniref:SDR family oxidoreductase n=1 Tax=Nocardioides vastitatis TaxID=2568655 RepID=A0ABW0ZG92_9ACTN|nr:SDR family oxidoreductase [Nocardioides sp.]
MNAFEHTAWSHGPVDLSGRTVLVLGATGGVGEGVTRTLLEAGATVLATSRSAERLADLADRLPGFVPVVLDALDSELDAVVQRLRAQHGPLDGAIVSVASWGGQGRKPLLSLTDTEWAALTAANQTAVFRAYRALVPVLKRDGLLLQLNGMSADIPFPGSAGVALTAAATKSMTRTLAAELALSGPRVYEVVLGVIRTRARQLAGIDDPGWIPAEAVGVHIAELLAGTSPLTSAVLQYFVNVDAGPQPTSPTS